MANKLEFTTNSVNTFYYWDKYNTEEKMRYSWEQYATDISMIWKKYLDATNTNYFYRTYSTTANQKYYWPTSTSLNSYVVNGGYDYQYKDYGVSVGLYPELIHWPSINITPAGALDERENELYLLKFMELKYIAADSRASTSQKTTLETGLCTTTNLQYPVYRGYQTPTLTITKNKISKKLDISKLNKGPLVVDGVLYGCMENDTNTYNFSTIGSEYILFAPGLENTGVGTQDDDGLVFNKGYTSSFTGTYKPTLFLLNPFSYYKDGVLYNVDEVSLVWAEKNSGDFVTGTAYICSSERNGPVASSSSYSACTDTYTIPNELLSVESTSEEKQTGYVNNNIVCWYREPEVRHYPDCNNLLGTVTSTDTNAHGVFEFDEANECWYVAEPSQRLWNWTMEPIKHFSHTKYTFQPYGLITGGYCNTKKATDLNITEWSMENNIYTIPCTTVTMFLRNSKIHLYKYPVNYNQVPTLADDTENRLIVNVTDLDIGPTPDYFPYTGPLTDADNHNTKAYSTRSFGKYVQQGYRYIAATTSDDETKFYMILPNSYLWYEPEHLKYDSYGNQVIEPYIYFFNFSAVMQRTKPPISASNPSAWGIHGQLMSIKSRAIYEGEYVLNSQTSKVLGKDYLGTADIKPNIDPDSTLSKVIVESPDMLDSGYRNNQYWLLSTTPTHYYITDSEKSILVGADSVTRFTNSTKVDGYVAFESQTTSKNVAYFNRTQNEIEKAEKGEYLQDVYSFKRDSYPDKGQQGAFYYIYKDSELDYFIGSELIETVSSLKSDTYPRDGRMLGYWYVYNGSTTDNIVIVTDQYIQGGITYRQTLQTSDGLEYGVVSSAELEFTVLEPVGHMLDNSKCIYYTKQSGDTEWQKIGEFYTQELKSVSALTNTIRLQDKMYLLDSENIDNFTTNATSQRLTYTFVDVCEACGLGTPNYNVDNPLPINILWNASAISGLYKPREVLGAIAAINGGYIHCNPDGVIELKQFQTEPILLDNTQYAKFQWERNANQVYNRLTITDSAGTYKYDALNGNVVSGTVNYIMLDNCILNALAKQYSTGDMAVLCNNICSAMNAVEYTPSYLELLENKGFNIGDRITIPVSDSLQINFIVVEKIEDATGCKISCFGQ